MNCPECGAKVFDDWSHIGGEGDVLLQQCSNHCGWCKRIPCRILDLVYDPERQMEEAESRAEMLRIDDLITEGEVIQ